MGNIARPLAVKKRRSPVTFIAIVRSIGFNFDRKSGAYVLLRTTRQRCLIIRDEVSCILDRLSLSRIQGCSLNVVNDSASESVNSREEENRKNKEDSRHEH